MEKIKETGIWPGDKMGGRSTVEVPVWVGLMQQEFEDNSQSEQRA